jgi:arylsulfatase A-like enzyme
MAGLFVVDLLGIQTRFLGFDDPRVMAAIMAHFRCYAFAQRAHVLLTLVAVGAVLGATGEIAGRAWDWARFRQPRRGPARGAVAALLGHGVLFARSVAQYPHLYAEHLYDRGGLRRDLVVLLTDRVSLPALDAALALVLCSVLLLPLLSRRGRARLRDFAAAGGAIVARRGWVAAALGAALSIVAGSLALGPCGSGGARLAAHRNLLVVAVDSLRPDRVFAPDAAARFPNIARLASRGVRFREAYVTHARTFPSMVSLLTGRFPHSHGIRHMFPPAAARDAIGPTLASALRGAGWRTAAAGDYSAEIFTRTPLGFDEVDAPPFDLHSVIQQNTVKQHPNVIPYASSRVGRRLFPRLEAMAEYDDPDVTASRIVSSIHRLRASPFFLMVFLSGPHCPYVSPAPHYRRFTDPAYRGPFRYLKQPLPFAGSLPREDARQVHGLYDGGVAATDAAIGRVLRRLEEDGLAHSTIVVLLADHGENLFDVPGRGLGHGEHLLGSVANHIPLVIHDPTRAFPPHDVRGIVRDVDVAPTLARLLEAPAAPSDGVDLSALLRGERDTLGLEAYAETGEWFLPSGPGFGRDERLPYPPIFGVTRVATDGDIFVAPEWDEVIQRAKHRAIRTERWKLVCQPTPHGVRWRLYDIVSDPDELRDVAQAHPEEVAELGRRLGTWMGSDGRAVPKGERAAGDGNGR